MHSILNPNRLLLILVAAQGVYYVATGLWAILSISTFQMVTGPKIDLWLVKTVGMLLISSGTVFLVAAIRKNVVPEVMILAMGNAFSFAIIDITYVLLDRISRIYLLDAFAEIALIVLWIFAWRAKSRS